MSDETPTPINAPLNIPRRDALKTMAAAAAAPLVAQHAVSAQTPAAQPPAAPRAQLPVLGAPAKKGPRGTPSDPDLQRPKVTWELKLLPAELVTLRALCDMIIPADEKSPSAGKVGAHNYINEWASRPGGENSLIRIRGGVLWIDRESQKRFGKRFHEVTDAQRTQICDDICYVPKAKPGFTFAAQFFDTVRDQTSTAFYTTPEGWKDLGYIGNVAMLKFEGPSAAIRKQIGLV